jgi:anti-anti-sigma factor
VPLFHLSGRLGCSSSEALTQALSGAVDAAGRFGVVVDLEAVDYLSSAGLQALESFAARLASQGRELILCGALDSVKLALILSGPRPNIAIEPSAELAMTRAASRS